MKFIRLALISFPKSTIKNELEFPVTINNVGVDLMLEKRVEENLVLLIATIIDAEGKLSSNKNNYIEVEKEVLDSCHFTIEAIANLIGVSQDCERHISSPHPTCAIYPENQEEIDFLNSSNGIQANSFVVNQFDYTFSLKNVDPNLLGDRPDGIALLAEAISHKHETGRFHELTRFFERGFASAGNSLYKSLLRFLSSSNFNYTKKEVSHWCHTLRNPLTHADKNDFLLERDVIPSINRMKLAAYDVLLNKIKWRDPSSDRRRVWRPTYGALNANADIFLTKGKAATLGFQLFDELGIYPLNLQGFLTQVPDGWYTRFSKEESN